MSETKTNVLVVELVGQQPSSFKMDGVGVGPDDDQLQTNITAPNARKIRNVSKYAAVEGGKTVLKRIRYIKGCDLIHIEEQEKGGFTPNPVQDTIWILNGKRTVLESEGEIGLYNFLKLHEGNTSNAKRPSNAQDIFKEINTTVKAKEEEVLIDLEMQAMTYVNKLKWKEGDKTAYDLDAIEFLSKHFKIAGFEKENPGESWVALVYELKSDPAKFMHSVLSLITVIETDVAQALAKGIISDNDGKFVFTSTGKVIMESDAKWSNDEKQEELSAFFSIPQNRVFYDNLRAELHNKKMNATGVLQ